MIDPYTWFTLNGPTVHVRLEELGVEHTVADVAALPWMRRSERQGVDRDEYPNFQHCFNTIEARRNKLGDAHYAKR